MSQAGGSCGSSRISREAARAWIDRWDAQQESYQPDREERFTVLIDAVAEASERADPLILDIGCGPGSLSVRLIEQIPDATVVAVDVDPLLLELGRAAWSALPNLRFVEADLRAAAWSRALGLSRVADAAVSTSALHWVPVPELHATYAEIASMLRPGAILLNGDYMDDDANAAPTLVRLGRALAARDARRRSLEVRETWAEWWQAAATDPALTLPAAERERRGCSGHHHGQDQRRLSDHVSSLRSAGFAEIGTLWQRGPHRLLCGVLAN
jgi:trans-aconitate methyltransferase